VSDATDEGGDPACWAHLFDADELADAERPSPVAPGSPSPGSDDDPDGPA
jgi:hypothetical protein